MSRSPEQFPSPSPEGKQSSADRPDIESGEFNEEEARAAIQECWTFEELYAVLRDIGEVPGSKHFYGADDLVERIEQARTAPFPVFIEQITRTAGLRDKVAELLRNNEEEE